MRLPNIIRVLSSIPTLLILAVTLPFLFVGLSKAWKAQEIVKDFSTAPGIVVGNDYQSRTDPQNSAKTYWSYHPVVRFTTGEGYELVFTDAEGSHPADYEVGDAVEVLYDPENPRDAAIRSWLRMWMGPLWVTALGFLPILGLVVWAVWHYSRTERRIKDSRNSHRC